MQQLILNIWLISGFFFSTLKLHNSYKSNDQIN